MEMFPVRTTQRHQFVDVTDQVQECIESAGLKDGLVCVFVPHTTFDGPRNRQCWVKMIGESCKS